MIDLHAHFGDIAKIVGYDLRRVMEGDGVIVETGDMVCLHTGYAELLLGMGKSPDTGRLATACALDGRDERLLEWITDSGLSVLVADNVAVEVMPATSACRCSAALPLHEHCLFKLGVHLGEFWHLTFSGCQAILKHEQGLCYVAEVFSHPGEPLKKLNLAAKFSSPKAKGRGGIEVYDPATGRYEAPASTEPVHEAPLAGDDNEARKAYQKRVRERKEIIDDPTETHGW